MSKVHHLIVVPGLGGENRFFRSIVRSWEKYGFRPQVCDLGWRDGEITFQPKLKRLLQLIGTLSEQGGTISLVGTSTGGSAVLNAFIERKDTIHKVVNICGRLRAGHDVTPTLAIASQKSPAFRESVLLFEKREALLSQEEKKRVLTLRAVYDGVVPSSTAILTGAHNRQLFSVGHTFSITAAIIIYARPMIEFLKT